MENLSSICVYCGSRVGADPQHLAGAMRLGSAMVEQNISLVFGGGRIGLMGVIADAVMAGGGQVIGVIPEHLDDVEVGHQGLTELHVVDSMHTRKQKMFELADAFVVLPGGLGTLDETFEIITWRQLGLHDKPVILVDDNGYWQPFQDLIDHVVNGGFADSSVYELFTIVKGIDDAIPAIRAAPEPKLRSVSELL